MDDRGGGDFVAAFCSWRHRLCSAKPQREALRIALQELDGIFEKKLFDSPPQCPLEELDARLQRELELMEVDAKALFDWYCDQPTTFIGTDEEPRDLIIAAKQRHGQSPPHSFAEVPFQGTAQCLDIQPPSESEADRFRKPLTTATETDRCQPQSNGFGENEAVATFKEVAAIHLSPNDQKHIDVTDETADNHHQPPAANTAVCSKYTRGTAVQELIKMVRQHEDQEASNHILSKRNETLFLRSDPSELGAEPLHHPLVITSHRFERSFGNASRRGTDRQTMDLNPRMTDEAQHKAATEQHLRDLLRETCSDHVNNYGVCAGPGECSSAHCDQAHICNDWWYQAKRGDLNGCSYGGEGVSHYENGRKFNHIKPNCQHRYTNRKRKCDRVATCLFGHDNHDMRVEKAKRAVHKSVRDAFRRRL